MRNVLPLISCVLFGGFMLVLISLPLRAEPPKQATTKPANPPFQDGYVPPEQLDVPDGLEVSLWAKTPKLYNPVNMDVDAEGRVWVLEGMNYGPNNTLREDGDRVVVLEDTNGDGRADTSQVFVQDPDFETPMGVSVIGNRVLVSQPPALHMYVDVNRNQRYEPDVDRHETLLDGFISYDHGHGLYDVNAGPDGRWYLTAGNRTVGKITGTDGRTFYTGSFYNGEKFAGRKSADGHAYFGGAAYRINPDGSGLQIVAHNMRNPVGWYVDSFGRFFGNDNDDPPASRTSWMMKYANMGYASVHSGTRRWTADRKPWQDHASAHWHQKTPGAHPAGDVYGRGAPAGLTVYENGVLGKEFRGLLLSAETVRTVVYGYRVRRQGAGYTLKRSKFLKTSTDAAGTWFRPSDVTVGSDGTVYVSDWFDRRVGGHTWTDDRGRGAIYRITREGARANRPDVDLSSVGGMVDALKNPANNVRFLGLERLFEEGANARPALMELLEHRNPFVAARALWPLARAGEAGREAVRSVLMNTRRSVRMRVAAFRALEAAGHDVLPLANTLSTDPSPVVRREVALAMRDVPFEKSGSILLNVAERFDGKDRWYLEAFGTGCSGKRTKVYRALVERAGPPTEWSRATARLVWRLRSPAAVGALKTRATSPDVAERARRLAIDSLGYVYDVSAARAMEDVARRLKPGDLYERAKWYLEHHGTFQWSEFDVKLPPAQSEKDYISTLNEEAGEEFSVSAYLNAGTNDSVPVSLERNAPRLTVKRGKSYNWTDGLDSNSGRTVRASTVAYHDRSVLVRAGGLDPNRRYRLGVTWWDYDNSGRVQGIRIKAGGRSRKLVSGVQLPAFKEEGQPPEHLELDLPGELVAEGTLDIEFLREGPGNAVVSEVWLLEAGKRSSVEERRTDSGDGFDGEYPAAEQLTSRPEDPKRGKRLFFGRATCSTCHRMGNRGRRFGPELTRLDAAKSSIIDSIMTPSASIAHGYQAINVKKEDGTVVTGFVLSKDDPVVLERAGGSRISVPRKEIKTLQPVSESLMPSARQLNLSPQDLVDLASFLSGDGR